MTILGFIRADVGLVDVDFFLSSRTTFDLNFDFDKDALKFINYTKTKKVNVNLLI